MLYQNNEHWHGEAASAAGEAAGGCGWRLSAAAVASAAVASLTTA